MKDNRVDPGTEKITQTDNLAKKQMLDSLGKGKKDAAKTGDKPKKKGFFSRLFGR